MIICTRKTSKLKKEVRIVELNIFSETKWMILRKNQNIDLWKNIENTLKNQITVSKTVLLYSIFCILDRK